MWCHCARSTWWRDGGGGEDLFAEKREWCLCVARLCSTAFIQALHAEYKELTGQLMPMSWRGDKSNFMAAMAHHLTCRKDIFIMTGHVLAARFQEQAKKQETSPNMKIELDWQRRMFRVGNHIDLKVTHGIGENEQTHIVVGEIKEVKWAPYSSDLPS